MSETKSPQAETAQSILSQRGIIDSLMLKLGTVMQRIEYADDATREEIRQIEQRVLELKTENDAKMSLLSSLDLTKEKDRCEWLKAIATPDELFGAIGTLLRREAEQGQHNA